MSLNHLLAMLLQAQNAEGLNRIHCALLLRSPFLLFTYFYATAALIVVSSLPHPALSRLPMLWFHLSSLFRIVFLLPPQMNYYKGKTVKVCHVCFSFSGLVASLIHHHPHCSTSVCSPPRLCSSGLKSVQLICCVFHFFLLWLLLWTLCSDSRNLPNSLHFQPRVSTIVTIHLLSNYSALCIHLSITSSCFLLMCQQCRCAVNVKCSIFTVISVGGQILLAALSRGVCNNLSF